MCSLVCVLALVLLGPVAQASPPDSLWLPGIYDAADSDDAAATLVSVSGLLVVVIVADRPTDRLAGPVSLPVVDAGTAALPSALSTRAPPVFALAIAK
jgi:hypothetical protein